MELEKVRARELEIEIDKGGYRILNGLRRSYLTPNPKLANRYGAEFSATLTFQS